MSRSFTARTLLAACGVLVLLLSALTAMQYQWSVRVAAADVSESISIPRLTTQFLRQDAWALRHRRPMMSISTDGWNHP
jgi:hypothetical protein